MKKKKYIVIHIYLFILEVLKTCNLLFSIDIIIIKTLNNKNVY